MTLYKLASMMIIKLTTLNSIKTTHPSSNYHEPEFSYRENPEKIDFSLTYDSYVDSVFSQNVDFEKLIFFTVDSDHSIFAHKRRKRQIFTNEIGSGSFHTVSELEQICISNKNPCKNNSECKVTTDQVTGQNYIFCRCSPEFTHSGDQFSQFCQDSHDDCSVDVCGISGGTVRSKILVRLRNLVFFGVFQNNFRPKNRNFQNCPIKRAQMKKISNAL